MSDRPGVEKCWCCGEPAPIRGEGDPWEGRMDGYCYECSLTRCDTTDSTCSVKGRPKGGVPTDRDRIGRDPGPVTGTESLEIVNSGSEDWIESDAQDIRLAFSRIANCEAEPWLIAKEALARLDQRENTPAEKVQGGATAGAVAVVERVQELAVQAQDVLDVLASGSEPWASTGYGYEHMGDYTRDVKPLCEALVALASTDGECSTRLQSSLPVGVSEAARRALDKLQHTFEGQAFANALTPDEYVALLGLLSGVEAK